MDNVAAYDIFKKDCCGNPLWVEAVRDLETARRRVSELLRREPCEYVIFCHQTQDLISAVAT